ncbi:hypothetical protein LguiA_019759 [Lonicera macranthoides]
MKKMVKLHLEWWTQKGLNRAPNRILALKRSLVTGNVTPNSDFLDLYGIAIRDETHFIYNIPFGSLSDQHHQQIPGVFTVQSTEPLTLNKDRTIGIGPLHFGRGLDRKCSLDRNKSDHFECISVVLAVIISLVHRRRILPLTTRRRPKWKLSVSSSSSTSRRSLLLSTKNQPSTSSSSVNDGLKELPEEE